MKNTETQTALLFRAPTEDAEAARRLAEAEDRSLASVLRKALRTYLDSLKTRTSKAEVSR